MKESIFDIRPWKVFGEDPLAESSNSKKEQALMRGKLNTHPKIFNSIKREKFFTLLL